MATRINPYTRLLSELKKFLHKMRYRHTVVMWNYPKDKLSEEWNLTDLYERTKAAQQLGYDVMLEANDSGLKVFYKKQMPRIPSEWQ